MKQSLTFACLLLCVLGAAGVAAEERKALATFACKESMGVDWAETLVTYPLALEAGQARPGGLRLLDAEGRERPYQFSRVRLHADGSIAIARLSFRAALKPEGSYLYRLVPGEPEKTDPVRVEADEAFLTLSNSVTAVRLPAKGEHRPVDPLRFGNQHKAMLAAYGRQAEIGIAPGPLQGVQLADGRWAGGSYFWAKDPEAAPKVTAWSCTVLEQGPLFAEARVRYELTGDGFYQMTVRLLKDDPAVRIDEQFDTRVIGSAYTWRLMVSLSSGWRPDGWKPDTTIWQSPQGRIEGRLQPLEEKLAELGFPVKAYQSRNFGSGPLRYDKPYQKVFDVAVWYPWHQAAHYFGLVDSGDLTAEKVKAGEVAFLAVVPMHAGTWRGAHGSHRTTMLFTHQGADVNLNWPLRVQRHPQSLLHTGEYDPEVPFSFGRRQWALMAGSFQFHDYLYPLRAYEGYVNLDDYKDWVLDWPADTDVTYPRLVFGPEDVARVKKNLAAHPGADVLRQFLYFREDEARRERLWKTLTGKSEWGGPRGQFIQALQRGGDARTPWIAHYRHTQMAGWVGNMDELLSSPNLSKGQRRTLRTYLAALCSMLSEPDFNPRGSMIHLGNPNMPINRFMALPFAASLIPDYPRAAEWLDVSDEMLRYKLAMNTAPRGVWSELITYFPASAPHIMQAATVLGRTGRLKEATARLAVMPAGFTLHLLSPPDPRFGARTIPNWGHEGYNVPTHWLVAAALMQDRDRDPQFAEALAWAWERLGRPMTQHHDAGFSERVILYADLVKGAAEDRTPDAFGSTWLPGFGAVMRSHAGTAEEVFLAYRQGYMVSHCDPNQGDFTLYAKGVPMVTMSLFAYPLHQNPPYIELFNNFGWHSHVRAGTQKRKMGGWNASSEVHAYAFSPGSSVHYLRGAKDQGGRRWQRQIMFMKSRAPGEPAYFVFRDSFREPEKTWWYLRTWGEAKQIEVTGKGLLYRSPLSPLHPGTPVKGSVQDLEPQLHVQFLQPASIHAESRQASRTGPLYHQAAINWRKSGSPIEKDHHRTNIRVKETLTVTAVGPVAAGEDILCVLHPKRRGEEGLRCERLADGVLRVTSSAGVDYVFMKPGGLKYEDEKVAFEGVAGAVRVFPRATELVVSEGPATVRHETTRLSSAVPHADGRVKMESGAHTRVPMRYEISMRLNPKEGAIEKVADGVVRQDREHGVAWAFDSDKPMTFERNGIVFRGRRGGIVIDDKAKTVRFVLVDGHRIGARELLAQGCDGPYDITFHTDCVTGRSEGLGRFLRVTMPPDLDRLPVLVIDGRTFAPGTQGRTAVVPLLPGSHEFVLRELEQPPVFRNWQDWE